MKAFVFAAVAGLAALAASALTDEAVAKRSAADQALYEKAWKECRSNKYPSGTRPHINYKGKWFRCVEPRIYWRN